MFCLLLLTVRFVVLPWLETNRGELIGLLARQIGHPVEITALTTGWDGWNPRIRIRGFRIVDRDNGVALVTVPEVRLTVAWTSLLFVDLRLKELAIDGTQLALRRDPAGLLHVGGLIFDPALQADERPFADWILRQPRILIHDATLVWRDELANGSELVLDRVELRLEHRFGHLRFGLTGVPPPQLAAPLDLRGDLTATSLTDWRAVTGRIYARMDYADLAAWHEWLPMAVPVRSGKGALRVWSDLAQGRVREIVADVVLADVQAQLGSDLPELTLSGLEGRLGWSDDGSARREFYTRNLTFTAPNGVHFAATDFKLALHAVANGEAAGRIEFTRLELTPLRQIAGFLPLPTTWREELSRLSPSGTLEHGTLQWEGAPDAPHAFSGSGRFVELGFAAQGALPGVAGMSGNFDSGPQGGTLKLDSRALMLDLPRLYPDRVAFDSLQGQVRWHRDKDGVVVNVDQLSFANQDLAGSVKGDYTTESEGPGLIDASAHLTRADVRQVYRYVPLAVEPAVRDWLQRALVAGTANDVRLKLSGRLAELPFGDPKSGQFQLLAKAQGVTLDYVEHWPALTAVDADIRIDGPRFLADLRHGTVLGVELARSKVDIADLRPAHPVLRIDGAAAGPTAGFLRFVAESPLVDRVEHATDGVEASGKGELVLKVELPLGKPEANKLTGEYTFDNGRLLFGGGVPAVSQLSGKLMFSEHAVSATALTGELLSGPAHFSVVTVDGRVQVDGQGTMNLALLRSEYPQQALFSRVAGTTDWRLALRPQQSGSSFELDSTLKGALIDLPPPAGKAAAETMALKIERRVSEPGRDSVSVTYGAIGRIVVERRLTAAGTVAERALVALGGATGEAQRRGLWVRGDVGTLDLDGWLLLKEQLNDNPAGDELPLSGIDISVRTLDVFGREFSDLQVGATRAGDDWQFDLRGREVAGSGRWQTAAAGHPNGRLSARLQRFSAPGAAQTAGAALVPKSDPQPAGSPWPELDIVADSFTVKGRDLGKLELLAQPSEADWRIHSLAITSDDGKLEANGWWRSGRRAQQTQIEADLDVRDAGKYLARFGLADSVRGAPTHLHGQVTWAGAPHEFDYPSLNGAFHIDTGAGQFTKVDPGMGKLLGVLSLQSIKRRLEGDYQDLFGEGFAFDDISGDVRIQDGVMRTDGLKISGPAAHVTITGETDIARETQKLRVRVQPTLSSSLSFGAWALLLANPVVGAAIAGGTLLAQKALQDPFEQIFASEYLVTGSWSDPQVEPAKGVAPTAAAPGESSKQ